ncbi:MAG: hypothetical protein MIO90_01870 [Methanomassiliicoccales archaeon]|nr:hypothetical protein [Methanomassiliicoccales archaeon]
MNDRDAFVWVLGLGTLALSALTVAGMILLKRRLDHVLSKDLSWSERLLSAVRLESAELVTDDRSSVVLLLEACWEMPRWLKMQRKGVWHRKPWKALLVFFLLSSGVSGIMSYNSGTWGGVPGIGGILFLLGALLVLDEHCKQAAESRKIEMDWKTRMSMLETVLGLEDWH